MPGPGNQQGSGGKNGPDGDGNPGSGGINRGRGDAPMVWGDRSDSKGTKVEKKGLPAGKVYEEALRLAKEYKK